MTLYSETPGLTINIRLPSKSYSKMYGAESQCRKGLALPGIWPPPGEIPSDLPPPPSPFSKFLFLIYYWGQKQRRKDRPFRYMHQLFEM